MKTARPAAQCAPQEPTLGPPSLQAELAEITAQLFRESGLKVESGDPLAVAALLQSRLLEASALRAARQLEAAAQQAGQALAEAAQRHAGQGRELEHRVGQALLQLADGARRVGEEEMQEVRVRLARAAAEAMEQVRHSAVRRSGWRHWWRDPAGLAVGLAFGLAAGMGLGLYYGTGPSNEQLRLMHNGLLLDAAWPTLTPQQRAQIGAAQPLAAPRSKS